MPTLRKVVLEFVASCILLSDTSHAGEDVAFKSSEHLVSPDPGQSLLQVQSHRRHPAATPEAGLIAAPQQYRSIAVAGRSDRSQVMAMENSSSTALIGSTATLDQKGFHAVAASHCELEMELYIRRIISSLNLELCYEDGLINMLQLYTKCFDGIGCDFRTLVGNLSEPATSTSCSFIAPVGWCQATPRTASCPSNPDISSHRRRQCNAKVRRDKSVFNQAADVPGRLNDFSENVAAGKLDHELPSYKPTLEQIKRLKELNVSLNTSILPEGAVWCEVRLKNLPPYWMAVYDCNIHEDWVSYNICQNGYWEENDIEEFGVPGHMLDIGGNLGYHTFAFAAAGWTVTTFEPMEPNLRLMEASLLQNPDLAKRISVNWFGLGPKNEVCEMMAPKDNVGDGFTRCGNGQFGTADTELDPRFEMKGAFTNHRLDEVLQQRKIKAVDFVKIDVEGYEHQVFAGAPDFLSVYRPRLIKSEVWWLLAGEEAPVSGGVYLRTFTNAGYQIFQDAQCKFPVVFEIDEIPLHFSDLFLCLLPSA
jgi:FkbM family methyltransferase